MKTKSKKYYMKIVLKGDSFIQGRPQGGASPPPETEKIFVEKWCYFPELYKMTKVLEDRRKNGYSIIH